jgi:hypothetical protein
VADPKDPTRIYRILELFEQMRPYALAGVVGFVVGVMVGVWIATPGFSFVQ